MSKRRQRRRSAPAHAAAPASKPDNPATDAAQATLWGTGAIVWCGLCVFWGFVAAVLLLMTLLAESLTRRELIGFCVFALVPWILAAGFFSKAVKDAERERRGDVSTTTAALTNIEWLVSRPDLTDPNLVYWAGGQVVKVRFLMIVSLACAAGSLYWAYDLSQTYGLAPGDGGALKPLPARVALAAFVASLGLAFAGGMWVFGRHYVSRVTLIPDERRIAVETIRFFGNRRRTFAPSDLHFGRRHRGQTKIYDDVLGPPKFTIDAPWQALQVKDERWPLIIDWQGYVADRGRLHQIRGRLEAGMDAGSRPT